MGDYLPLDLDEYRNGGLGLLGTDAADKVPMGERTLRGLPFRLGSDPERCFVALGRSGRATKLAVPVGQIARTVIFAQRLLESSILDGGPVGTPVATYVFRYADGSEVREPIRDRFEIAAIPTGWGQLPFRAVPDQSDSLPSRYEGPFGHAGNRQTEVRQASPRGFFLWTWVNPKPETPLAEIVLEPEGPSFIVGGITLGQVDEFPFVRSGARPLKLDITDRAVAARPFDLAVQVDRGTTTFPYPLPSESLGAAPADRVAGWGESPNQTNRPAYVEVAAIPSATITVKSGDDELGSARWSEVEAKGAVEAGKVRIEVVDPGRNWVRTTILDADTGQPIPCRVHFRSPEGVPFQPHGHHAHVNGNLDTWHVDVGGDLRLGQISYAYVDGTCEGWLPRGDVKVEVARGFEYEPLRTTETIAPGQQELTLRLKRWTNLNRQRWFSGDTHVHFLSTQGGHTEARGEDLNVVNLLLSQWGHLFTNTEEFVGRPTVSPDGATIVYATQENRQHFLGHLTLLGLKKQVAPWCSDGPSEAEMGGTLEVTMSDWADRCHAQGGTVILPHLPNPNGEPAAMIATGRVDGVEMIRHGMYEHQEYYRYLNAGYRLPLVGGTDKMSSEVPVGLYRTYVNIPADEPFTYESWCANLTKGRTFHSGGPILSLKVDGHDIGDTVRLPGNGGTVEVEARAESIFPIHTLQIVQQGKIVAATEDARGARQLALNAKLRIDGHTWIAARAGGPDYARAVPHHDVWRRGIMAHTSPVYVAVGGDYWLFDSEAARYLLTLIEGTLGYIRELSPRYRPDTVTHHHGEADHQSYLERPFLEAREAIHRRMHELGISHVA